MSNAVRDRIGNLIDVPQVQTVIELSETRDLDFTDPESRLALEQLAQSFVITEDIRNILIVILGAIARSAGRGFFVTGNFGSGKSHLLSVLSLSVQHAWARRYLSIQDDDIAALEPDLGQHRILPVLVPLTEYGSELPLKEIVWGAIEVAAASAGIPLSLSHTQRFLHLFNRYILPVHQSEFTRFLETRLGTEYSWVRIQREDPASAHTLILQYMQSRDEPIPFSVQPDHQTVMAELTRSLKSAGRHGTLLILDELSEFLKSKDNQKALNEDARFLQFLGESATHHPFWIVAALQETIERIGNIHESVHKKIKDRYVHRLRLSAKHLKELVARRLIRRKGIEADQKIIAVYRRLHRMFNKISITENDFLRIYPVHPETLELLDKNSDLFSRRRGIVDFLTARIRGRPEENIPGILDRPVDHLLTPDIIFDHFRDRLSESPEFCKYYQLYQSHFEPKITAEFSDADIRNTALRIIKILILLAISPFRETRTVREICNMILFHVLDESVPAGNLNYEFIYKNILLVLHEKIGHLRLVSGKTFLESSFSIDMQSDSALTLENKIRRICEDISPLSKTVLRHIYSTMSFGLFPFAGFFNQPITRDSVRWENTFRRIELFLCAFTDIPARVIESSRKKLMNGDVDFVLFFGWIGDTDAQRAAAQKFLAQESGKFARAWGFYLPDSPADERIVSSFSEAYACWKITSDIAAELNPGSNSELGVVKNRLVQRLEEAHRQVNRFYEEGILFTADGRQPAPASRKFEHLDQWIAALISTPFAVRFPEHKYVAPRMEITGNILPQMLFERLILPGKSGPVVRGRDEAFESAIKGIALPTGLAKKDKSGYILAASPRNCPLAKAILNCLPPEEDLGLPMHERRVALSGIFRNLATSTLGVSRTVFDLTVLAMIRKGYLTAMGVQNVLTIQDIGFPIQDSVRYISRGDILPARFRPAFAQVYRLLTRKSLTDFDLDIQEKAWLKLREQFGIWSEQIRDFDRIISRLSESYGDNPQLLSETRKTIQLTLQLNDSIDPDVNPRNGWQKFLVRLKETGDFETLVNNIRQITAFMEIGKDPYCFSRNYLNDPRIFFPDSEKELHYLYTQACDLQILKDDLILSGRLQEFLSIFSSFHDRYIHFYQDLHSERNRRIHDVNYSGLLKSSEMHCLKKFSALSFVSVKMNYRRFAKYIQLIESQSCTRDVRSELMQSPVCRCDFRPGRKLEIISEVTLLQHAQEGIRQYVRKFQSSPLNKKLELLKSTCPADMKQSLEVISTIDPGSTDLAFILNSVLTPEFMEFLERSIRLQLRISSRQIHLLVDELTDQTLTATEIRKVFDEWMKSDGEMPGETDLIRVEN